MNVIKTEERKELSCMKEGGRRKSQSSTTPSILYGYFKTLFANLNSARQGWLLTRLFTSRSRIRGTVASILSIHISQENGKDMAARFRCVTTIIPCTFSLH